MKKSKILIPAMSMLLLSTVASVSGTVAWFTANRAVQITTTEFEVTKLDSDLTAALTAGAATEIAGTSLDTVKFKTGYKLCDASYNKESDALYTKSLSDSGDITGFASLGDYDTGISGEVAANTWIANSTNHIWYAASWKITFTYTFAGSSSNASLFFNASEMLAEGAGGSFATATTVTEGSGSGKTQKGFRLSFDCVESSEQITWAPFRTTSESAKVQHVTGTGASATAQESNVIFGNSNITQATDAAVSTHNTRLDYLGTFTKASAATATLNVRCVVWYEGTDEDVINTSDLDKVSATLKFYVRNQIA